MKSVQKTHWKNKVVMLTGASSGIGAALARALAKEGATLGLIARREDHLQAVAAHCESAGGTARVLPLDVTDPDAVSAAAADLRVEFGHIDVMIANAGIAGFDAATRSLEPAAVRRVIEVNLIGAVNSVYAVLPQMLERGSGHLVAISSLAGFRGLPKSAAYSASKAGMTAYFESVRLDTLGTGVDVTIIQPGFIKTPLTAGRKSRMPFLLELEDSVPKFLAAIEKRKRFAAFPWQTASIVRAAQVLPSWLYDRLASRARYRQ